MKAKRTFDMWQFWPAPVAKDSEKELVSSSIPCWATAVSDAKMVCEEAPMTAIMASGSYEPLAIFNSKGARIS